MHTCFSIQSRWTVLIGNQMRVRSMSTDDLWRTMGERNAPNKSDNVFNWMWKGRIHAIITLRNTKYALALMQNEKVLILVLRKIRNGTPFSCHSTFFLSSHRINRSHSIFHVLNLLIPCQSEWPVNGEMCCANNLNMNCKLRSVANVVDDLPFGSANLDVLAEHGSIVVNIECT